MTGAIKMSLFAPTLLVRYKIKPPGQLIKTVKKPLNGRFGLITRSYSPCDQLSIRDCARNYFLAGQSVSVRMYCRLISQSVRTSPRRLRRKLYHQYRYVRIGGITPAYVTLYIYYNLLKYYNIIILLYLLQYYNIIYYNNILLSLSLLFQCKLIF